MSRSSVCSRPAVTVLPALLSVVGLLVVVSGCGGGGDSSVAASEEAAEGEVKPEDRPFLDAARPFVEAIAARNYQTAYGGLASCAKLRMSPSQFIAPADDATQKRNETSAIQNPTTEQFAQMMQLTESEYGKPAKLVEFHVYSTDPIALSGKGKSLEQKLDTMFAIGMMPESIPIEIRKASVRSKLLVELSAEQLGAVAQAQQTTVEKLKADPDFQPYITLKVVLVEESGGLKVGYFEFLPPGIMD